MNIDEYLLKAIRHDASDIHICVGLPPVIRKHGRLLYMDEKSLTSQQCESIAKGILTDEQLEVLDTEGEVDFAYTISEDERFRVNVFKQQKTYAVAFRTIANSIPDLETLGLPEVCYRLANKQRGLVLVTGPTGSGKSTTLASMIDYINMKRRCRIITIEDPIEFKHKHNRSVINQRELGVDTMSYTKALRAALREDPDIIMVGEMRDKETISTALTAAETGHLVFSTLHTVGAAKTIDRIIDAFPPHQQSQIRSQLSTVLVGIVSQQLVGKIDDSGRVPATEVLINTPAIANLIRENKISQIHSSILSGGEHGMHTMDTSIANHYNKERIDYQNAIQYSMNPEFLKKLIV